MYVALKVKHELEPLTEIRSISNSQGCDHKI